MDKVRLSKAKKKAKVRKIVNTVVNLFCVPIFILVLFTSISVIIAAKNKTAPAFVGYSLISITTGSMEESGFGIGEIIMIKKNNPKAILLLIIDTQQEVCLRLKSLKFGKTATSIQVKLI